MLSLRTIARAAPRASSRLTPTSASTFRPAFTHALRSTLSSRKPCLAAAFSTTRIIRDEHSQQLAAKLSSEIALEIDDTAPSADSDSNVEGFLAENPFWSIQDVQGEQDVFLTREFEDETVTVHFSIADFNSSMDGYDGEMDTALSDEDEMDVQSGGANTKGAINRGGTANANFKVAPEDSIAPADREELRDEEDEVAPAFSVNVQVLIQRPSKGALKFGLVASDGDFMIHQLTQLPADSKSPQAILRSDPDALYTGPPFQQLDEELQGILESYLNARGITSSLAVFVPDYIDSKEQKEYFGWLERVKDFVE